MSSVIAPVLITVGGVLLLSHTHAAGVDLPRATAPSWPPRPPSSRRLPAGAPMPPGGWWWPLPPLAGDGRKPQISDGLGSPRDGGARVHHGADLGYWRRRDKNGKPTELLQYVPGTSQASHGGAFVCPDGTPLRAAAAGRVWSVSMSPKGIQLVIDHGHPYATYSQHLKSCKFPLGSRGQVVAGGQVVGVVGNGHDPGDQPADAYNHSHWEVWYDGGADCYIDPADVLKLARY